MKSADPAAYSRIRIGDDYTYIFLKKRKKKTYPGTHTRIYAMLLKTPANQKKKDRQVSMASYS
jgi:hypothetical protein